MSATLPREVLGRKAEQEAIARLLHGLLPAALVLEGEPGIGKTTLWRSALSLAEGRGYQVLACSPAEAEQPLSFASLTDLFSSAVDDVLPSMPPPQRRAFRVALLREDAGSRPPDRRTVSTAVLGALRALAALNPVLLAVDDAQWLDGPSAGALSFAVRRLEAERVALVVAQRAGEVVALALPDNVVRIVVGPLSLGALHLLLSERLGVTFPRPTLRKLHESSEGNPFFALELARELERLGIQPDPGEPLPVPPTLSALVEARLARLPRKTRELLQAASALSEPTLELFGTNAAAVLRPAIDAEVVRLEEERVRFAHPLLASAAYAGADRELHARLAEVVPDPEERARHLAHAATEPEERVAASVERGAIAAFARGAPAAAAELSAQAARLTPTIDSASRLRRAIAEAEYWFEAGDAPRASAVIGGLIPGVQPGPDRALLLSRRARFEHFAEDVGLGVALLSDALAEAGDDVRLRAEIQEGLAWGLLLMRRDLPAAARHAREAVRAAERQEDRALLAEALAAEALTSFVIGGEWEDAMGRALELEPATLELRVLRHPSFALGYLLSCADELERARDVFADLHGRAQDQGDESALAPILNHLCLVELLAGDWDRAERLADESHTVAVQSGQRPSQASVLSKLSLLQARRGLAEEAGTTANRALELAGGVEAALGRGGETAIWTLGFISLSAGRPEEADRHLGPLVRALLDAGVREPGEMRALPDEVEALVSLGRVDEAEELLEPFEESARRLGRPSALGAALRCHGLVLAARGRAEALDAFASAVESFEAAPLPFERARALLDLGAAQRRARRKRLARETLRRALAEFSALGAPQFAGATREELDRVGGRAPAEEGLTPSEHRVAALVGEGKSNKEVAAALFVTVKTVEGHLSRVYEKLGVRSRTELARRIAGMKE